ncbi:MAG TPA: peptidoglycan DD-metalloendopeptidase family protein [Actinomycetota bacterium]|nr:peptidoglycan DD-metalloendopeptidase family protein [Actinomycetota bacterium]
MRCLAVATLAASLLLPVAARAQVPPQQVSKEDVQQAKRELSAARERLRRKKAKVAALQERIQGLAQRIAEIQAELARTERGMERARQEIAALEARLAEIQREIDLRSRHAFMLGPATGLQLALSAGSYVQLTRTIGLLEEMNREDALLAAELVAVQERMNVRRAELQVLELRRLGFLLELDNRRRELREAFAEQRVLLGQLRERRDQALRHLSLIRPLALCPVDGPHAIADDFGAPRVDVIEVETKHGKTRQKKRVRSHQGNDIFAPAGTPIVAPFDGVAVKAENELGGLAVKVIGEFGYVYNAHLSRYGKLGPVETGDVIGYVGTTGNARGTSPHDHFEWHPNGGPAVDPHPFLLLVC